MQELAQQKVLSLSKEIVPAAIRDSINDFLSLQTSSDKDKMFSSIPLDIVDERKAASIKRKHSATEDAIMINKMAKKEDLVKTSNNQKGNPKADQSGFEKNSYKKEG